MSVKSIVPIIDDEIAIKILGLWNYTQDIDVIATFIGVRYQSVQAKVELLMLCGLITETTISGSADKLLLATATKALKR